MQNIKFFDNQTTPVLVLDYNKEIVYTNNSFNKVFGNIKNLSRFARRFFFDICLLNSENIENHNPIMFALGSKESFFAQTVYQTNKNEYLNFDIHSYVTAKLVVITFNDTTAQNKYDTLLKDFMSLRNDYAEILKENKKYSEIQQKAQSQAIKMALLNRFANIIRESVDINKIINSALSELCTLTGGFKAYFAENNELSYKIKLAYPARYATETGKIISFDDSVNRAITAKSSHTSKCLKEYNESTERFKTNTDRIIIPIFHQSNLLGIIVILSYQNISLTHEDDVLKAISLQLANALVQASLFEQINTQNAQLEKTLTELKETQLQLINSEKMASLGQLIAGVAHEINTPLASINSNNSIFERLIKKLNSTGAAKELLDTFKELNNLDREAIKRISKIVVSLKQFVRLDEADLQEANINKELELTLDLIRHETKNKIEITRNYGEIRPIKCYPNMLNQVFMNLLMNACQSIENQGQITISTIDDHKNLFIKIKDNGCGIKPENKDKIFQAGFTSKGVGVGTGLGLAITKKIIEKHNGTITFDSEIGKGTEFIVTIPY